MVSSTLKIIPAGDSAILIKFGNFISEEINKQVHQLQQLLETIKPKGIIETIPAYTDLLVLYDPCQNSFENLSAEINKSLENPFKSKSSNQRLIKVPVCYEDEFGADLGEVSKNTGLSKEEIIKIHSESEYLVYMLGFTPGFS